MGFFSRSKPKEAERFLILNIGSSSVTVAFAQNENDKLKIIANEITYIEVLSDLSYERFEKEMLKALASSLHKISKLRLPPPDKINVCLSSPWYASQIRTAKMSRPSAFVISQKVLDDMISREIKAFEEEEVKSRHNTKDQVRAIEYHTISANLNGYAENNPVGLSAKEVELTLFLVIAPERTLKLIEDLLEKFYLIKPYFDSFLSASYFVAREKFSNSDTYMILDIGGEITDVAFVKNNTLISSFSFPQGKNFILRKIAFGTRRSLEEAKTLCILHTENKTTGEVKEQCEKFLSQARDAWQLSFQNALTQGGLGLAIPEMILMTISDKYFNWFSNVIENEQFHQNSLASKKFKIIHLNSVFFHEDFLWGEKVLRDPFIMIEALSMKLKKK